MNKSNLQLGHPNHALAPLALLLEKLEDLESSATDFPTAISVPNCGLNIWQWLDVNDQFSRFVWSDRNSEDIWGGVGEAARLDVQSKGDISNCILQCRKLLKGNRDLKFFGGLSFDGTNAWKAFGAGRFVIPRLQLSNGRLTLAVMGAEDIQQARLDLQQIRFDGKPFANSLPAPIATNYVPTADGWQTRVDEALSLIRSEALEKIVLSRKSIFEFPEPLNPIALTSRLQEATHNCFVFCFNFGESSAFVGATPECLYLRLQDLLQSEVIAGTRMRGQSPAEDEALASELLFSDKDQREHDIVRKSIRQKLHKYVDHLTVDNQASILKLARKQHLRSNVQGKLKPNVDDGMLLERLHPTPAVGGYPTDNALPEIARIEPFNRGWYAAPIGWIGADSAHFAVAIRSGLIEANTLSLFSGAGIVRGSEPDEEWQEVENKIQDFVSVLGR